MFILINMSSTRKHSSRAPTPRKTEVNLPTEPDVPVVPVVELPRVELPPPVPEKPKTELEQQIDSLQGLIDSNPAGKEDGRHAIWQKKLDALKEQRPKN